jgi:branched-chain amino acid transport system substrate-binding protein
LVRRAVALSAALLAGGCGAGGAASRDVVPRGPLTIYTSLPLRGVEREHALDVVRGERRALARAGGRAGAYAIRLVVLDDSPPGRERWAPESVAANARVAVRDRTTIAYLGEGDTAASSVSVPLLNEEGILQVSPSDTFAGLTRPEGGLPGGPARFYPNPRVRRGFGRMVPDDLEQSRALVSLMTGLGARRIVVLRDDSLYAGSLAAQVAGDARASGIAVVDSLRVDLDAADLSGLFAGIRIARPDAILFASSAVSRTAQVWRELHRVVPAARLLGPSALALPSFAAALGRSERVTYLTGPSNRLATSSGPWAGYGAAAMSAVLDAIRRARGRGRSRKAVVAAFLDGHPRRPAGGYAVYRVRAGRLHPAPPQPRHP